MQLMLWDPADWPSTVTVFGSSPNAATLRFTHLLE